MVKLVIERTLKIDIVSRSSMEPLALFHLCVYQWFRKLAQLAGIDLFNNNYKPSALTYTLITALLVLLASCLWTIYSYEFDEKVICASMLAFNFQVISIKSQTHIKVNVVFVLGNC